MLHLIHTSISERMGPSAGLSLAVAGQMQNRGSGGDAGINLQIFNRRALRNHPFSTGERMALEDAGSSSFLDRRPSFTGPTLALEDCQPAATRDSSRAALAPAAAGPESGPPPACEHSKAQPVTPATNPGEGDPVEPDEADPKFDQVADALKEKLGVKGVLKKPSAKTGASKDASTIAVAKPKAKPKAKAKAKSNIKVMKKPSGNVKLLPTASSRPDRPPNCLKLRPKGCSKCRWKPGCTPSCWRGRNEW